MSKKNILAIFIALFVFVSALPGISSANTGQSNIDYQSIESLLDILNGLVKKVQQVNVDYKNNSIKSSIANTTKSGRFAVCEEYNEAIDNKKIDFFKSRHPDFDVSVCDLKPSVHNTHIPKTRCPQLYRNLFLGLEGSDVKELQNFLKQKGYYTYRKITGYFGPATQRAVQRFQAKMGIISYGSPESTGFGVVGPKTRERMRCGAQLIGTNTYHQQMIASDTIKRVDVSTEYKSYTCPGCSRPEQTPIKVLRVSLSNGQIVTALSKNQYWKFGKVIGISSNRQYVAFTVLPETGSADIHIYVFDARTRMSQKVTYNGNPVWLLKDPSDKDAYWESDVLYLNKDGDLYKSRSIKQPWNLSLLSVATRNCKRTFNDEDQQIYYENQYPQYSGLAIEVSTKTACLHFCDGIETENPGQCIYNGNVIRIWD